MLFERTKLDDFITISGAQTHVVTTDGVLRWANDTRVVIIMFQLLAKLPQDGILFEN